MRAKLQRQTKKETQANDLSRKKYRSVVDVLVDGHEAYPDRYGEKNKRVNCKAAACNECTYPEAKCSEHTT